MNPLLAARRTSPDRVPFEEAWFIEGSLDNARAFWLRYTLRATAAHGLEAAVWAAAVEGDLVVAARQADPTPSLPDAGGELVRTPAGGLSTGRATGSIGELSWDVSFEADRSHDHLPHRLARLGLSGRHYASPGLDLRVSGSLAIGPVSLRLDAAPAVLGHIWGHRANTQAWAWAHCAAFDDHPEAQFEALSARLRVGGVTLPWATSAALAVHGRHHSFTRTRTLFQTVSNVHASTWSLEATDGQRRLRARAELPAAPRIVRVGLNHTNGATSAVHNSPLSSLRVHLTDPDLGEVVLRSQRASLELAHRGTVSDPHMSG